MKNDVLLAERAFKIAGTVDLNSLLLRFQIDDATKRNLEIFSPLMGKKLDKIATRFYEYVGNFPEMRAILSKHDKQRLRRAQTSYWTRLFAGRFDSAYLNSSVLVGLTHFKIGLPAYLYLAGYSFFQNEIYRIGAAELKPLEFAALAITINKVVALDIAIALHAYYGDAISGGETTYV